jgi:butyrate kinase
MIDGNDIVGGEGPMAPTRCGSVPVVEVLKMLNSVEDIKAAKALCTKTGGFVSHLGTSDALEVSKKAADDDHAKLIWNTMIYQIIKEIGAMATALGGEVDGILLGGGMVHNKELVSRITESCSFIAPVTAYPGEFEMEAMAAGAIRVLKNEEPVKTYTGEKIWTLS